MKCNYEIIDNYLEEDDFLTLQEWMLPPYITGKNISQDIELPWIYGGDILQPGTPGMKEFSPKDKLQQWQLVHVFQYGPDHSPYYKVVKGLLKKLDPMAVWRIKANLSIQQSHITEAGMHIDPPAKTKHTTMITSIYYLNTNNGYTKLEDGTKIKSVANRLVSFNSNILHTGSTCTDSKVRVAINLNYFKDIKI